MHRHGYQGRKLSRQRDQRNALIRGQVTSLVLHDQIVTTLPKAKEVAPVFERMVTKAKKGDLANYRQITGYLTTEKAAQKLAQEIAPSFKERQGGYTRIIKLGNRRGDNAPMAALQVVKDGDVKPAAAKPAAKAEKVDKPKAAHKKNALASGPQADQVKPQSATKQAPIIKRRTNA